MILQKRVLFTYSFFILVVVVLISGFYFRHNANILENTAQKRLNNETEKKLMQLDNIISIMDFASKDLFSQIGFYQAMATLTYFDRNDPEEMQDINKDSIVLEKLLYSYTLISNFYKIAIFTDYGYFFSNKIDIKPDFSKVRGILKNLDWLEKSKTKFGRLLITHPYKDPWSESDKKNVFSVFRVVPGISEIMGYIEVQRLYSDIEEIMDIPNEEMVEISAVTEEGEILYHSGREAEDFITTIIISSYSGIKLIAKQDKKVILGSLYSFGRQLLLASLFIFCISISFVYIASIKLTKPIMELTELMGETELDTLSDPVKIRRNGDEIEKLERAFWELKNRLKISIQKEIKTASLQQQANFDALQAQIDPHFIFNILNVISRMGLESNNEEICDVSNSIAEMLRYSTSTKRKNASIKEEIKHLSDYLMLLKKRYEEKLAFSIKVEDKLMSVNVPRITLQPFIENCINHGFNNNSRVMEISVIGWFYSGVWYIEILDNGDGFKEETLINLKYKICEIDNQIKEEQYSGGIAPGGLGIINTYTRLSLFLNGEICIDISNRKNDPGARIFLSGKITGNLV